MDPAVKDYLQVGLQILNFLLVIGMFLYVRYGDRSKDIDRRLAHVEGQLGNAPTHQDLAALRVQMNEVATSVSHISGQLQHLNTNINSLMNNIINKGLTTA